MRFTVRIRRAAQAEFDTSVDWYEAQSPGLGVEFAAALQLQLSELSKSPRRWPEARPGVRELVMTRWPFAIYYQVHSDHVMVLAVFHTSRDPAIWQGRT